MIFPRILSPLDNFFAGVKKKTSKEKFFLTFFLNNITKPRHGSQYGNKSSKIVWILVVAQLVPGGVPA
jgi:hypothetical protein